MSDSDSDSEPLLTFRIPQKVADSLKTTPTQHYSEDYCKVAYLVSLGRSAEIKSDPPTPSADLYEGIVAGSLRIRITRRLLSSCLRTAHPTAFG